MQPMSKSKFFFEMFIPEINTSALPFIKDSDIQFLRAFGLPLDLEDFHFQNILRENETGKIEIGRFGHDSINFEVSSGRVYYGFPPFFLPIQLKILYCS
jgi:hypothetical protein